MYVVEKNRQHSFLVIQIKTQLFGSKFGIFWGFILKILRIITFLQIIGPKWVQSHNRHIFPVSRTQTPNAKNSKIGSNSRSSQKEQPQWRKRWPQSWGCHSSLNVWRIVSLGFTSITANSNVFIDTSSPIVSYYFLVHHEILSIISFGEFLLLPGI